MILLTIFFVRDSHSFTVSPMFTLHTGYLFVPTVKAIWFSTQINTYPICDSLLQRLVMRSFGQLQKSRLNHRSYV